MTDMPPVHNRPDMPEAPHLSLVQVQTLRYTLLLTNRLGNTKAPWS